jgi:hypothetical protein
MWVCRYGSGSLYVHIEDGWSGCAGAGKHAYRPHHRAVMAATLAALSDDKNAIIMAPE